MYDLGLVDANHLAHRHYHTKGDLKTSKGLYSGVFFGVLSSVRKFEREFKRLIYVFDGGNAHLKRKYSFYKGDRAKKPQEFYDQLLDLMSVLRCGGKQVVCLDGREADEVLSVLAHTLSKIQPVTIITSDTDLMQLINPRVKLWDDRKSELVDEKAFKKRFDGLIPTDLPLYKAMAGDASDYIGGLPGIGDVSAIKFIKYLKGKKVGYTHRDIIQWTPEVFKQLVTSDECPWNFSQKATTWQNLNVLKTFYRIVKLPTRFPLPDVRQMKLQMTRPASVQDYQEVKRFMSKYEIKSSQVLGVVR